MDKLQVSSSSSRRLVNTTQPTGQNRSTSAGTHAPIPRQSAGAAMLDERQARARKNRDARRRTRRRTGQGSSPDKGPGGGVPLRSLAGGGVSQLHGRKSEKRARDLPAAPPPPPSSFPAWAWPPSRWRWYPRCFSSGQRQQQQQQPPDLLRPARPQSPWISPSPLSLSLSLSLSPPPHTLVTRQVSVSHPPASPRL